MLGRPASWNPVWKKRHRRIVIDGFGLHRPDDADVIGDLLPCAAAVRSATCPICPCCAKLEDRRRRRKGRLVRRHAGEPLPLANRIRQLGAAQLRQLRLVIEQIELRGRAVLEQIDDALRLRREMRQPGQSAPRPSHPRQAATPARRSPIPLLAALKKCRRVSSSFGFDRCSFLGHRFVQVEDQARHRRVGGQLAPVQRWVRARFALAQERLRVSDCLPAK